jgi:glycosyltransferase involved in cell wall biosynthesis
MKTALIIPTLNEIQGMKMVISKIKKEWVDEVIIVDGGSTDGTVEEAENLGFEVLKQKTIGSHGAAIFDGFEYSKAEMLLMFGADGNNEPEEIPKMIEMMKKGYDQVIITRFGKTSINEDAGAIDAFGNKMFTSAANFFFGGNLSDTLSSSRAITRKAWNEIKFNAFKTDSTQQISIRGMRKKQKMIEIDGNEPARIGGNRKMKPIQTGIILTRSLIHDFFLFH